MKRIRNESGFAMVLELILVALIAGIVAIIGYRVYQNHHKATQTTSTPTSAAQTTTTTTPAPATTASNVTVVKTTDGHAQFSLPTTWKVASRKDGGSTCGFAVTAAAQGTCLLDVTIQPTAFDAGGRAYWYTKIFATTKAPKTWNADVNGTGAGACDNAVQSTINGYQELICKDSAGGTEYVISNGQYLAYFSDPSTDTGSFANATVASYEPDFKTILNSIKFN